MIVKFTHLVRVTYERLHNDRVDRQHGLAVGVNVPALLGIDWRGEHVVYGEDAGREDDGEVPGRHLVGVAVVGHHGHVAGQVGQAGEVVGRQEEDSQQQGLHGVLAADTPS